MESYFAEKRVDGVSFSGILNALAVVFRVEKSTLIFDKLASANKTQYPMINQIHKNLLDFKTTSIYSKIRFYWQLCYEILIAVETSMSTSPIINVIGDCNHNLF